MMLGAFGRVAMEAVMVLIPMILSLSVHECAHALVARTCGDHTAERLGRLTLNPMAHVDPVGTLLLPFSILLLGGMGGLGRLPLFGFARPTPVDAKNFKPTVSVRRGCFWVALAGPLANLALATLCAALLSVASHTGRGATLPEPLWQFLRQMLLINLSLTVFNLVPLGPLDGHQIVANALPLRPSLRYEAFNRAYGNYALWGLILFGGRWLVWPVQALGGLLLGMVGFS